MKRQREKAGCQQDWTGREGCAVKHRSIIPTRNPTAAKSSQQSPGKPDRLNQIACDAVGRTGRQLQVKRPLLKLLTAVDPSDEN